MRLGNCYSHPSSYGYLRLWLVLKRPALGLAHSSCIAARVAYPLTRNCSTDTSMSSRRCSSRVLSLVLRHWLNVHPIHTPGISWRTPSAVQSFGRFHLKTDSHGMWDMWFGFEQRSSKRLPLGHRTLLPHPVQSARRPFIRLLIASIIVGCAEPLYVPYLPSCHGAHRHARSCSSSIHPLARSKRLPRVMLWTTELRERAPRLMGTA